MSLRWLIPSFADISCCHGILAFHISFNESVLIYKRMFLLIKLYVLCLGLIFFDVADMYCTYLVFCLLFLRQSVGQQQCCESRTVGGTDDKVPYLKLPQAINQKLCSNMITHLWGHWYLWKMNPPPLPHLWCILMSWALEAIGSARILPWHVGDPTYLRGKPIILPG